MAIRKSRWQALLTLAILAHADPAFAGKPDYDAIAAATRKTLATFIAAQTTNPPGNEARIVQLVEPRLRAEGIEPKITEFAPGRQNIVARLKATRPDGSKPILLIAHTDVVTAEGQQWTVPAHQLTERGKFLLGRGSSDMLGMAAAELEIFLHLKRSKTPLRRDVILALTGDEESEGAGIRHIIKTDPDSVNAAVALNEGGGVRLDEKTGKATYAIIQGAEKTYMDFELVARSEPGHSSVPLDDNAIFRLSEALAKLKSHREPPRLTPITRGFFENRARLEPPARARAMLALARAQGSKLPAPALAVIERDPQLRILLRTTCVPTTLKGGTRVNSLPDTAIANVNCRIMPDESVEQVREKLARVVRDPEIEIRLVGTANHSKASPVDGEGPTAIRKVIHRMWPGIPILPFMEAGASDSVFLRQKGIAAYGMSPFPAYESDDFHVHGEDERVPVSSVRPGVELLHRVVLELAVARSGPRG